MEHGKVIFGNALSLTVSLKKKKKLKDLELYSSPLQEWQVCLTFNPDNFFIMNKIIGFAHKKAPRRNSSEHTVLITTTQFTVLRL